MKTIQTVPIWDNGQIKEASILNAYAINVILNTSSTFWYGLFSQNEDGSIGSLLTQGNLTMTGEAYTQWETDNYAWDWAASELNLTIIGDYVYPVPITTTSTTTENI